jgi:hypothetical protein
LEEDMSATAATMPSSAEMIAPAKEKDVKYTRSKHTYRRYPQWSSLYNSNPVILASRNHSNFDKHLEIPVTEIDDYFPDGLLCHSDQNFKSVFYAYGPSRTLNTPDRWNDLVEDLERLSISKARSYDNTAQAMRITYSVPIKGHLIVQKKEDICFVNNGYESHAKHPDWLCWNGTYYDPRYIYTLHNQYSYNRKFRKLGVACAPTISFKDESITELPYRVVHQSRKNVRRTNSMLQHQTACYSGAGWLQTVRDHYLEIDLRTEVYVTHIGTAGRYPITCTFPSVNAFNLFFKFDEDEVAKCKKAYSAKLRHGSPSIQVAHADHPIAYVTQYKIQYFHAQSKRWIGLSDVFQGNHDALTENVNNLSDHFNTAKGIYTRYLRIEPIAFQFKPYMRVAVYGINTAKKNSKQMNAEEEVEVITYTLVPGKANGSADEVKECMAHSHSYYRYDNIEPNRFLKMKYLTSVIQDGVEYGDDDLEEDYVTATREAELEEEVSICSARRPVYLSDYIAASTGLMSSSNHNEYDDDMQLAQALSLSELEQNSLLFSSDAASDDSFMNVRMDDEVDSHQHDSDSDYILIEESDVDDQDSI